MKIYVAGKNLERARKVMDALIEKGHTITFDWVKDIDNNSNPKEKAICEREAVKEADVLVYLWGGDQESARYEAGMAMALHTPIIIFGFTKKQAFFTLLPEIISADNDDDIISILSKLQF